MNTQLGGLDQMTLWDPSKSIALFYDTIKIIIKEQEEAHSTQGSLGLPVPEEECNKRGGLSKILALFERNVAGIFLLIAAWLVQW